MARQRPPSSPWAFELRWSHFIVAVVVSMVWTVLFMISHSPGTAQYEERPLDAPAVTLKGSCPTQAPCPPCEAAPECPKAEECPPTPQCPPAPECNPPQTQVGVAEDDLIVSLAKERRFIVYVLHVPESKDLPGMNRYIMTLEARRQEASTFFPGWKLRLYLDGNFHAEFKTLAERTGYEVIMLPRMDTMPQFERSAQRLQVLDDENVDRFVSRDLDSTLGYRDVQSTFRWIETGKAAVMQHDHAAHWNGIMAGMWGARRKQVRELLGKSTQELLDEYRADTEHRKSLKYDNDQGFNDKMVLPKLKGHAIHFDSAQAYCKHSEPDCFPFPMLPAVEDGKHMGKRAYGPKGPLTEIAHMLQFNCKSWSSALGSIRVFETQEFHDKWPAAFNTMKTKC